MNDALWADYAQFHKGQAESKDLDPVYDALKNIGEQLGLTHEQKVWLTFLHVAYYHLGSALKVFQQHPNPSMPNPELLNLPTGTERRAHRSIPKFADHFNSLLGIADANGGLANWLNRYTTNIPLHTWDNIGEALTQPRGNGRWAAYKTSEMLWKVNGYPMQAPDMGHAHSSGPRQGLNLLFNNLPTGNNPADVAVLDLASHQVLHKLTQYGITAALEEAETSLCDFHSLAGGKYYVGHDIDQMQTQLNKVQSELTPIAFTSRQETIPNEYLGELNGWVGVDPLRKKTYKTTGQILLRTKP